MLKKFNIFKRKEKETPENPFASMSLKEIPRYPPFKEGLPSVSIEQIISTQQELIENIRSVLSFTLDEHERLLMPIIRNFASFVHLLPASENHHHRGAGGLFRHGLEVGYYAALFSEDKILANTGSLEHRLNAEPKWRFAAFLSGIGHDLGKPCTDIQVSNQEGDKVWLPLSQNTLYEFLVKNKINVYFLNWRSNRHKRHEIFSAQIISKIIPTHVWEFLTEDNNHEIAELLNDALQGLSTTQPLAELMLKADQTSVSKDLKENRYSPEQFNYGVPIDRYVLEAARFLVSSGQWKVNQIDGEVWHTTLGTFVDWKRSIHSLSKEILRRGNSGVPRDADTLAQILIDRDYVEPKPIEGTENFYKYWEIDIELDDFNQQELFEKHKVKSTTLRRTLMKLKSSTILFSAEPLSIFEASVVIHHPKPKSSKKTAEELGLASSEIATNVDVEMEQAEEQLQKQNSNRVVALKPLETPDMVGEFALHQAMQKKEQQKKNKANSVINVDDLDSLVSAGMDSDPGVRTLKEEQANETYDDEHSLSDEEAEWEAQAYDDGLGEALSADDDQEGYEEYSEEETAMFMDELAKELGDDDTAGQEKTVAITVQSKDTAKEGNPSNPSAIVENKKAQEAKNIHNRKKNKKDTTTNATVSAPARSSVTSFLLNNAVNVEHDEATVHSALQLRTKKPAEEDNAKKQLSEKNNRSKKTIEPKNDSASPKMNTASVSEANEKTKEDKELGKQDEQLPKANHVYLQRNVSLEQSLKEAKEQRNKTFELKKIHREAVELTKIYRNVSPSVQKDRTLRQLADYAEAAWPQSVTVLEAALVTMLHKTHQMSDYFVVKGQSLYVRHPQGFNALGKLCGPDWSAEEIFKLFKDEGSVANLLSAEFGQNYLRPLGNKEKGALLQPLIGDYLLRYIKERKLEDIPMTDEEKAAEITRTLMGNAVAEELHTKEAQTQSKEVEEKSTTTVMQQSLVIQQENDRKLFPNSEITIDLIVKRIVDEIKAGQGELINGFYGVEDHTPCISLRLLDNLIVMYPHLTKSGFKRAFSNPIYDSLIKENKIYFKAFKKKAR